MSLNTLLALHLTGVILLFLSLGGMTAQALASGATEAGRRPGRALLASFHGVALLLILVAGFGAMAKLGIKGSPPVWIWGKVAIWLLLAAAPALIKRKPDLAKVLWFVLPLLGITAAFLAVFKPGS